MNLPNLNQISDTTRQVATKSAMNPMLWVCGLTTPVSIMAAAYSDEPISYMFYVIACLPIIYSMRAYDYWMKNDPDRLQSERYLIERQIVGTMGYKSDDGAIEVQVPSQAILIENPRVLDGGQA